MGLAVIGLLDTDCDPDGVDIVIPGNDDSLKSVRLLIESLVGAVEEGAAHNRERLQAMGAAQRTEEAMPGDEPRPTRGKTLPRPAEPTAEAGAAPAEAAAAPAAPAEEPAPAASPGDESPAPAAGSDAAEAESKVAAEASTPDRAGS